MGHPLYEKFTAQDLPVPQIYNCAIHTCQSPDISMAATCLCPANVLLQS
jgi:hypothetical protein